MNLNPSGKLDNDQDITVVSTKDKGATPSPTRRAGRSISSGQTPSCSWSASGSGFGQPASGMTTAYPTPSSSPASISSLGDFPFQTGLVSFSRYFSRLLFSFFVSTCICLICASGCSVLPFNSKSVFDT